MRKIILLSIGFVSCAWFSSCSNDIENSVVSYCIETDGSHFVSAEQAKSNAIAFLNDFNRGKETRTVSPSVEVEDVVAYRSNDVSDSETRSGSSDGIVFYAVNLKDNQGFILASSDDRYIPVYAYIEEGRYDSSASDNEGFNMFIENIVGRFNDKKDSTLLRTKQVQTDYSIEPKMTTQWGLGYPYNIYSPAHHATTMNIALGQICAYFCYPDSFTYENTAPDTTYYLNWASIISECDANNGNLVNGTQNISQVNDLLEYLDYDHNEETFYKSVQTLNFFRQLGYSVPYTMHAFQTSDEESLIYGYLSSDHLIYARGSIIFVSAPQSQYASGAAWVVDGMSGSYYHCNWGLFGNMNGYYLSTGFRDYQYLLAYVAVKPNPN